MLRARTADGLSLAIDHVPAVGTRRGVVVCLHAMMTDGRYFGAQRAGSFAHELAAAGFEVFVPDFRGHGHSRPSEAGKDDWSFDDLVELDLPAIVAACTQSAGCKPSELVLLGHSLGGLVTTAALGIGAIPSPKLVVLPATAVWLLGPEGDRKRRALMSIYRYSAMMLGRAPIRALRIGTSDEPRMYIEQLAGWARTGRWTSLRGLDYLAALATIDTPVSVCCAGADWLCRPDDARRFAAKIPSAGPLFVVDGANHFSLFQRDELRAWIRDQLA